MRNIRNLSKWTESRVLKKLWKHFLSHKYVLNNSYVFQWESDFLSMTASKFFYEVEVKVTRADFKADFKKIAKHKQLQNAYDKNKTFVNRLYLEYEVALPITEPLLDENLKRVRDKENKVVYVNTGRFRTTHCISTDGNVKKEHIHLKYKIISNYINIIKVKVPNRFFYAVPTGLITKDEVPEYAGLLYVSSAGVTQIKAAPVLHKEKMDLTKILLEKFYYISLKRKYGR